MKKRKMGRSAKTNKMAFETMNHISSTWSKDQKKKKKKKKKKKTKAHTIKRIDVKYKMN